MRRSFARKGIAVLLALLVWQAASIAAGSDILLVSPVKVLLRLGTIWMEQGFWHTVFFSLLRIGGGFFLAFLLGILLALAAGRFPLVETLLWPYVTVIKTVPVASFIIISLIWLHTGQLAVFISFLIGFPVIYSNVLQGMKSTDPQMLEMADVYRIPWIRRLGYVYLPQIKPFLLSGCSVALGMCWKAGVAAEVIGVVNGSIGEALYESKIYFEMCDLLAWTVVIVLLSVGLEKLVLFVLRRAFSGWEAR